MVRKFNEKGFTMVEIIAAIAIIGVLSGTAVVGVTNSLNKSHEDYCTSAVDMLMLAGRDYYSDHRSELPEEGQKEVSLQTLVSQNYIKSMTDYDGNSCDLTQSKVVVSKHFGNTYTYTPHLVCNLCSSKNDNSSLNDSTPVITFSSDPEGTTFENQDVIVNINISDSKNELVSYKYEILKKVGTNNWVRESTKEKGNLSKSEETIPVQLNRSGTYKIRVSAYNSIYKSATKESPAYTLKYVLGNGSGECTDNNIELQATVSEGRIEGQEGEKNPIYRENVWASGIINFKVTPMGSVERYNVYVSTNGKNGNYQIQNKTIWTNPKAFSFGKERSGEYYVKVEAFDDQGSSCTMIKGPYKQDNKAPSCEIKDDSGVWVPGKWVNAKNLDLKAYCKDDESKCKENTVSLEVKQEGQKVHTVTVADRVGNTGTCSAEIKIDQTPPVCTVSLAGTKGAGNWYRSAVTATATFSDNASGVAQFGTTTTSTAVYNGQNTLVFNSGTNLLAYCHAVDNAGNPSAPSSASPVFGIDTQSPTCTLSSKGVDSNKSKGKNWYNKEDGDVKIMVSYGDAGGSGVATCSTGTCSTGRIATLTQDTTGQTYNYSLVDAAGNTGSCSTTVKRDTKGPKIEYDQGREASVAVNAKGTKKKVKINQFGTCDYSCYIKDTLGNRLNYTLQKSKIQCFYVEGSSKSHICLDKQWACGGFKLSASDATSGVNGGVSASDYSNNGVPIYQVDGNWDQHSYEVYYDTYVAADNAGNVSTILVSTLGNFIVRATKTGGNADPNRQLYLQSKYKCTNKGWVPK